MTSVGPKNRHRRLSAAQCRAVDRHAIEQLGIPGVVLMENAGRNAADLIDKWVMARRRGQKGSPRISIVCGKGNNGGDGFVVARHLSLRGRRLSIALLGDPAGLSPDAAVNFNIAVNLGLSVVLLRDAAALAAAARVWRASTVAVDALLGTGFTGEVRDPLAGVIGRINALKGPLIVALDVPSGLDADTGEPGGVAVQADRTITFLAAKAGFANPAARRYIGRVSVVDIGAPVAGYE